MFDFREVGSDRGLAYINQFEDVGAVGLVGYSGGGVSAIQTAKGLQRPVDLLVQIDSYDPLTGNGDEDEVLPGNVKRGINYYQQRNRFNFFRADFDLFDLQGAKSVQGSQNINAEDAFRDRGITHRNIDDNPQLQARIVENVAALVLKDLTFDRQNQLQLTGPAVTPGNTLRLLAGDRPATAVLSQPLAAAASFQTQFQFRLPFAALTDGLSFLLGPSLSLGAATSLRLQLDPLLTPGDISTNSVALLIPGRPPQVLPAVPVEFNSGSSLTAWVNYDAIAQQLDLFLSDGLKQPIQPLLSQPVDLSLLGPNLYAGFRTASGSPSQYSEILSWQLSTAPLVAADVMPAKPLAAFVASSVAVADRQAVPEPGIAAALLSWSGLVWLRGRRRLRDRAERLLQ
ncbi:MAG: hypothetical protein F6J97_13250 [Leptolyngbya sp. SIO4C1]|nr:hypothetical protein [Leptolyngbya sp. SIO4C1]